MLMPGHVRGGPAQASHDLERARLALRLSRRATKIRPELTVLAALPPPTVDITETTSGSRLEIFGTTVNSGRIFVALREKPERKASALEVMARLRRATANVPGINIFFQPVLSINIATTQTRAQYQFACAPATLAALRTYAPLMEERMKRLTNIADVNSDLQVRARSTVIDIDRDTASRLGLSIDQIACCSTRPMACARSRPSTRPRHLSGDPRG